MIWLIVVIVMGSWVLSEFRGISIEAILAFALGLLIGWMV